MIDVQSHYHHHRQQHHRQIISGHSAAHRQSRKGHRPSQNRAMAYEFVVFDHPDDQKDRSTMQKIRSHVMHNHINKNVKPKLPRTVHARIKSTRTRSITSERRRHENANHHPTDVVRSGTASKPDSSECRTDGVMAPLACPPLTTTLANNNRIMPVLDHTLGSPLVHPPVTFDYRHTHPDDVPSPVSDLGNDINPFKTWPILQGHVNVERLKYQCSEFFGSEELARSWVPTLLTARHAFLSTICICAAHDDIMLRASQLPEDRIPFEKSDRFRVNCQVVGMINEAFQDDACKTADTTIIAVLQLLSSEIMGCDDTIMTMHQQGLHNMVRERGGLNCLGVNGHLASVLTINMYMISALRETAPHRDFAEWASKTATKPPKNGRKIPESPVYCRLAGFEAVPNALPPNDSMNDLLETLRLLTNNFFRLSNDTLISPITPVDHATPWEKTPRARIMALHDKIFQVTRATSVPSPPSSNSSPQSVSRSSDNAKHMFEAVRLTGLVYAYALNNNLPLSIAAATLSHDQPDSIHICIKRHLQATGLDACWGDLAGVLFWVTLVAGAAANPACTLTAARRAHNPDEEDSRKWLAAVAVRCSIVLGFEHGSALLETLKRLVGIEQALAMAHAAAQGQGDAGTEDQIAESETTIAWDPGFGDPGDFSFTSTQDPLAPSTSVVVTSPSGPTFAPQSTIDSGPSSTFPSAIFSALASSSSAPSLPTGQAGKSKGKGKAAASRPVMGPEEIPFLQQRVNFQDFADDFREFTN